VVAGDLEPVGVGQLAHEWAMRRYQATNQIVVADLRDAQERRLLRRDVDPEAAEAIAAWRREYDPPTR
jgi:hypothetical protein